MDSDDLILVSVDGTSPTAESIHLVEVAATEPFSVPGPIFDEVQQICTLLGIPL